MRDVAARQMRQHIEADFAVGVYLPVLREHAQHARRTDTRQRSHLDELHRRADVTRGCFSTGS